MKVDICNTDKKYNVIYADPAWQFSNKHTGGSMKSSAQDKYTVTSITDMCRLPVWNLADENCLLVMWYVGSMPKEAIQLCEAWGFRILNMNGFVWEKLTKTGKPFFGMGFSTRAGSESAIIAVKGKITELIKDKSVRAFIKDSGAVIADKVGRHSEKPQVFRDAIESLCGDVPRIELFARDHREGWDCWGNEVEDLPVKKVVAWWSAGVTSAVACKMALEQYGKENVDLIYFGIESAHPDNARFKSDCEKWYGKEIEVIRGKYDDQFDVIDDTRFINGPNGARCTMELKKNLRFQMQRERDYQGQVFGFEYQRKEINRALRFMDQYPDTNPIFPLIKSKLTKPMCLQILIDAGIEVPAMYKLGYPNNNCIGCVKGGIGYWNKIRVDFPDAFERMSELEREIGRSCLKEQVWSGEVDEEGKKVMETKRLFLDELDPSRGKDMEIIMPDCGSLCDIKHVEIDHPRLNELMND